MQNAKRLSLALLAFVSLLLGCQKQIADEDNSSSLLRKDFTVKRYAAGTATCPGGCLGPGEESAATSTTGDYNDNDDNTVTVHITNTKNSIIFRFTSTDNIYLAEIAVGSNPEEEDFVVAYEGCSAPGPKVAMPSGFEYPMPIGAYEACEERVFTIRTNRQNCTGEGQGVVAEFTATHKLVPPCCNIQAGDYFTYSQGFYMRSKNGADFLNTNSEELGDVTIGCATGTQETYSLADIIALDPGNSSGPGILAKQIITMTLNVKASEVGILGTETDLGCLTVVAGTDDETTLDELFGGMSVNEILEEANRVYGGCGVSDFSADELTGILDLIVQNFHEGAFGGLLTCGTCSE